MSIAIFTALQDTRAGVIKIQTTLEGLPTNLSDVCRTSTKEAIHEAISELKQEAYAAVGGSDGRERGFRNGEAEKIISQLVDQLAEQERIKEDEELLFEAGYAPLEPIKTSPVPYTSSSSSASRRSSQAIPPSVLSDLDNPFEPASSRASSISSRRTYSASVRSATLVESDSESVSTISKAKGKEPLYKAPSDAVLLSARDASSGVDLIDPVLASGMPCSPVLSNRDALTPPSGRREHLRPLDSRRSVKYYSTASNCRRRRSAARSHLFLFPRPQARLRAAPTGL